MDKIETIIVAAGIGCFILWVVAVIYLSWDNQQRKNKEKRDRILTQAKANMTNHYATKEDYIVILEEENYGL